MSSANGIMGRQPVRVLEYNVLAWFEEKYPEFRSELEEIGRKFGTTRAIKYYCDEAPIFGRRRDPMTPYVTVDNGQITIHETFLSYVWGLSYAFFVIFDEQVQGSMIGIQPGHGKPLGYFLPKGYEVLNYSIGLIKKFKKWPEDLPNPDSYNSEDRHFVERTNGIYLAAVDFILCHEWAHIACGHLTKEKEAQDRGKPITPREIKELEREADQWALDCVSKGIRPPERSRTVVGFGAAVGLGSLLFLNRSLTSSTHPDKNDRIGNVLSNLAIDERDNLWGVAATFYMIWDQRFNGGLDFSGEFDTYKDFLQAINGQLESKKRKTRTSRWGLD